MIFVFIGVLVVLLGANLYALRYLVQHEAQAHARIDDRSKLMYKQQKELSRELKLQKATAERVLVKAHNALADIQQTKSDVHAVISDPRVKRFIEEG